MANEKRLIDANALGIGKAKREAFDNHAYADGWNSAIEIIENAPTVDAVEVVHGRWELVEYQSSQFGVDQEYQCSICGTPADYEYITRYCPNCGAKMDGDGNG